MPEPLTLDSFLGQQGGAAPELNLDTFLASQPDQPVTSARPQLPSESLPTPDQVVVSTTAIARAAVAPPLPTPTPGMTYAPPSYQIQQPPAPPSGPLIMPTERTPLPRSYTTEPTTREILQTPLIKPEDIDDAFPFLVGPFRIHAGILKAAAGMTSPQNAAIAAGTAGLGAIPGLTAKVASTGLSVYFATQAGKALAEKYPQLKAAVKAKDWQSALELGGAGVADAAMFYGAGKHALSNALGIPADIVAGAKARAAKRSTAETSQPQTNSTGQTPGQPFTLETFLQSQHAPSEEPNVKTETAAQQIQPGISPRPGGGQPEASPTAGEVNEATPVADSVRRVTGSINAPLNDEGRQQAADLAQRAGNAGEVFHAPNDRSAETARQVNPNARPADWLAPWKLGAHEGKPLDSERDAINDRVVNNPDSSPGVSTQSGEKGESFNGARERLIGGVQRQAADLSPDKSVLNVTSGRALQIIDAWARKGQPPDRSVDLDAMTADEEFSKPGQTFKLTPKGLVPEDAVNSPGIHFAQHGATEMNSSGKGVSGTVETQPLPLKPLHEMGPDELDRVIKEQSVSDGELLHSLFGDDAKKYSRLERKSNSTSDPAGADKAYAELERMQESLTEAQRNRLFGITGPDDYDIEQARSIRQALGRIDPATPESLGQSLKWAVTKFDPENPTANPERYAQLRYAAQIAHENGWNTAEIMAHAFNAAAERFDSPENAAFMLERFRTGEPAGAAGGPALSGSRGASGAAYGKGVNIAVPGEQTSYPARYSIRDAGDFEPSHNPFSFEPNPRYEYQNDRDYRNNSQLSSLVVEHSGPQFNPDLVASESPTAEHGAPVIDPGGNVLGGNSRAMTLARVYQSNPAAAEAYRTALRDRAASYGLTPADVDRYERPVLVREVSGVGIDPQKAITDFNKSGPAALSPAERAVADGRRLSSETVTALATKLDDVGEDSTLAQALRGDNGAALVNRLVHDGVVTPQERNGLIDERGQLTGEAKDRIARMLVGRLFDSPAAYNATPPELRGKLERVAPQILRVEDRPEWNITPEVREAVNALADARAHGIRNLEDLRRQASLGGQFRSYSQDVLSIAQALRQGPLNAMQAFRRYANDEALSRDGGQVNFFEPPTRDEAFREAFERPAAARSAERGGISPELLTLGAQQFWQDDIAPKLHDAARAVVDSADDILKVLAPTLRSESSQQAALILRTNLAEFARKSDQAEFSLRQAKRAFDRMRPAENYEFIRRVEAGEKQNAPELDAIAGVLRSMLDGRRVAVQELGTGKLQSFYKEYFPHIWADPRRAASVFASFFGRGPLEGGKHFLKKRVHLTFEDGLSAGLKPVSDNPVDLVLLKVREMDKYLMAHETLNNWKASKLARYVDARTGEVPTGWKKIADPVGTVYGPSVQNITEYPNEGLWSGLGKVADALGIKHERGFTNLRGAVGRARRGGDNRVQTMHGSAEDVLAHEIGHQIDWLAGSGRRFVLEYPDAATAGRLKRAYATLKDDGSTLDDRRLAREELKSLKAAIANRKEFAKQLRDLADLRSGEKSYTRKREEKMAQLAEMWVGARDLFQRTAPKVFEEWKKFLDENPKLHALRDIEGNTEVTPISQPYDVGGLVIRGNWYAPEGAARILNNYLSPGLRDQSGIFRGLLGLNNVLNQFQLGMSAFHLGFTAADATVSKAALGYQALLRGKPIEAGKQFLATPLAAFTTYMKGDRLLKEWYTPGSQGAPIGNLVDNLVAAGGRARMDQMYRTQIGERMLEALRRGNIIGAALRSPFAGVEFVSNLIMNEVVPRMKLGAFADLARFHLDNLPPDATFDQARQVLAQDWNSIENRLGEMTYDNLFWNRTVKDLVMLTTRSVGWNLGTLREIGGGIADTVVQPANALRGKPVNLNRLSYLLGLVTVNAAMSLTYQYLKTGKGPDELEDYFFPKNGETDENGRPQRVSWPTYVKDVFHYATHPLNTLEGKVAPIWTAFAEMIHNRDFFGTEIRNPDDPLVQQLGELAKFVGEQFVPIGVRNYQRETGLGASPSTRAEQFVGITPAPAELNEGPGERMAREIAAGHAGDEPRTPEAAERRELRQSLTRSLRAHKGVPAEVIDAGEKGKLSKEDIREAIRASRETPLQQAFSRLGIDDATRVYAAANAGEKKQLQALLMKKWRAAVKREAPAQRIETARKVRAALAGK